MGHTVQAFIAKAEVLRDAAQNINTARVITVAQGFGLLPNTRDFYNEVGEVDGGNELPYQEFYKLSTALANFGVECSRRGSVAYIETDYWGGEGEQAAVLWERGEVSYEPARGKLGQINDVLRRMGVERGDDLDEFDALGLGRYRNNEDWIEHSR
ncbi:MAG TPA: hypothetical protein VGW12_04050 [Pyrinomonadaceae bacterium]|nr:hypothetical protein [Pyrinomonadaceae bacterium]